MNEWKKKEKCLKKGMFGKKESFRKHLEEIKNIQEEREGFLKEGRKKSGDWQNKERHVGRRKKTF